MSRNGSSIGLLCLFLLIMNCGQTGNEDEGISPPERNLTSMKGWELYSWESSGTWSFALVQGTNRLKTSEEIFSERVVGLAHLKGELCRLAQGEAVFWLRNRVPGTSMPPPEIVLQIKEYCREFGLVLQIA